MSRLDEISPPCVRNERRSFLCLLPCVRNERRSFLCLSPCSHSATPAAVCRCRQDVLAGAPPGPDAGVIHWPFTASHWPSTASHGPSTAYHWPSTASHWPFTAFPWPFNCLRSTLHSPFQRLLQCSCRTKEMPRGQIITQDCILISLVSSSLWFHHHLFGAGGAGPDRGRAGRVSQARQERAAGQRLLSFCCTPL